jgi:glycerol-3-phosphate cytidylyltransferase
MQMKTVLTYGTFDLFHVGHVRLLKRISAFGDRLIVGCSTDEFNAQKGKKSVFSYEERAEILMSCRFVSQVIPEQHWEQKVEDVQKYKVDVFAMGDDWSGKFDFLETSTRVIYLPRTEGISTTQVKDIVASVKADKKLQLLNAAQNLSKLIDDL